MSVRTISAVCLAATLGWAASAQAAVGGPDRFGYGWEDSDEPGVTYFWDDVGTTDCVTLNDDTESAAIPLGFNFSFYGTDYTEVRIGSNGYVAFQNNVLDGYIPQCPLPMNFYRTSTQTVNLAVYGFYNDLDPRENELGPGTVCHATLGTAGVDQRFVVTFDNVDYFHQITDFVADPVTFQIVLFEGSSEAQINIQDSGNNAGLPPYSAGNNTTIGIEDGAGAQGLSLCGWTDTILIPDAYSIRFAASVFRSASSPVCRPDTAPPNDTLTFDFEMLNFSASSVDVALTAKTAGWTATPTPGSVTVAPGGGSTSFPVDVTAPASAAAGDLGTITVTGTSGSSTATGTIQIRTTHGDSDWQGTATLPQATTYVNLVSDGDYIYALAGRTLDGTTWVVTDDTARWNPVINGWDDCVIAEMPRTVTLGGACAMNGHIYYVGGLTQLENTGPPLVPAMFLEDLLDYEIASDTWTVRTGPTFAVLSANVACDPASNQVFVYGGLVDVNQNFEAELPSVDLPDNPDTSAPVFQVYDVSTDTWEDSEAPGSTLTTPDPDFGLYDAAVGVIDDQIYFSAGSHYEVDETTGALQSFTTVATDLYDITSNTWTNEVPWLPSFVTRRAGVVFRDQMCVVGGTDTTATTLVAIADWWCLAGDTWVPQADPISPVLLYCSAAVLDDFIYLAGVATTPAISSTRRCAGRRFRPARRGRPVVCAADGDADGDGDVAGDADTDGGADADATADTTPDTTGDGTTGTAADAAAAATTALRLQRRQAGRLRLARHAPPRARRRVHRAPPQVGSSQSSVLSRRKGSSADDPAVQLHGTTRVPQIVRLGERRWRIAWPPSSARGSATPAGPPLAAHPGPVRHPRVGSCSSRRGRGGGRPIRSLPAALSDGARLADAEGRTTCSPFGRDSDTTHATSTRQPKVIATGTGRRAVEAADLRALPGIGAYTAAAVASIAFGQSEAVVDGNVARVLSRLFRLKDPRKGAPARRLQGRSQTGGFRGTERRARGTGLMELGATGCRPSGPHCGEGPLAEDCDARREGRAESYPETESPARSVRESVVRIAIARGGRWLLRRNGPGEKPEGMFGFPVVRGIPPDASLRRVAAAVRREVGLTVPDLRELGQVRHQILNRAISVRAVAAVGDLAQRARRGSRRAAENAGAFSRRAAENAEVSRRAAEERRGAFSRRAAENAERSRAEPQRTQRNLAQSRRERRGVSRRAAENAEDSGGCGSMGWKLPVSGATLHGEAAGRHAGGPPSPRSRRARSSRSGVPPSAGSARRNAR